MPDENKPNIDYCRVTAGGGYSGQPISWTRLEIKAGYRIVEAAGPMLNQLWQPH